MDSPSQKSRRASMRLLQTIGGLGKKMWMLDKSSQKENPERQEVVGSKKRRSLDKKTGGSRRRLSDVNEIRSSNQSNLNAKPSGRALLKIVEDAAPLSGEAYLNGNAEESDDETVMESVAESSMVDTWFGEEDSFLDDSATVDPMGHDDPTFEKELIPKRAAELEYYVQSPKTPSEHQTKLRTEVQDTIEDILRILAGYQKELLATEADDAQERPPSSLPADLVAQAQLLSVDQIVFQIRHLAKLLVFGQQDIDGEQATEGLSRGDSCALFINRISHSLLRIKSLVATSSSSSSSNGSSRDSTAAPPALSSFRRAVIFHDLVTGIRKFLEVSDPTVIPDVETEIIEPVALEALIATTAPMASEESQQLIKRCRLHLRRGGKWRESVLSVVPSALSISCLHDDKFAKEVVNIPVSSVAAVVYTVRNYTINIQSSSTGIVKVKCLNRTDFFQVLIAINGARGSGLKPLLSDSDKFVMMKFLYKKHFKSGGTFTSSNGEQWQYGSSGLVTQVQDKEPGLRLQWDGESLRPVDDGDQSKLGEGRFNGVWMGWHPSKSSKAVLPYLWCAEKREFVEPDNAHLSWKWKKTVLVSQSATVGESSWTVDGQVPDPVVMFVQMLRYYRNSKDL